MVERTAKRLLYDTRLSGGLFLLILIALWEILPRYGLIYARYFPPFSKVAGALLAGILSGEILNNALISISRAFRGYLLAVVIGVCLGTLAGTIRWLSDLLEITVELLRPMPSVALIPP